MANLSDDRGQLILATAIVMAVLFVSLALILNTSIYTLNLATRSSDMGGGIDAARYQDSVVLGLGTGVGYVNEQNDSDHPTLVHNISSIVEGWNSAAVNNSARRTVAINVSLSGTTNGTRIVQTDLDRNFTNATGATNWTLVESVQRTRQFRINVSNQTLLAELGSGSAFTVTVRGAGGDTWQLNVTNDTASSDTIVGIDSSSGQTTCTAPTTEPWINVTAGTVDDQTCDGLIFAKGLDRPYEIEFSNADAIAGTYELTVSNETLATMGSAHFDAGGSPTVESALYSISVDIRYRTPRLLYETGVRIAPGEPND